MIAPSPRLLVGAANAFVGVGELSRDDRGPVVDMMLRQVGMPGDGGWSTAFVHHVGYWSHFDHATRTSSWPLPTLGDANALAQFGREQRIEREQPEPFDLFALYSPARAALSRVHHARGRHEWRGRSAGPRDTSRQAVPVARSGRPLPALDEPSPLYNAFP
jgi:hypothetical protein